jgi:hypothetical protein
MYNIRKEGYYTKARCPLLRPRRANGKDEKMMSFQALFHGTIA